MQMSTVDKQHIVAVDLGSLSARAQDSARVALLIGNQGCSEKVGPLKNPHHDIAIVRSIFLAFLIVSGLNRGGHASNAPYASG